MRISDWSSDVCSSDLGTVPLLGHHPFRRLYDGAVGRSRAHIARGASLCRLYPSEDDRGRRPGIDRARGALCRRSEEHTSELQSLMRISYAVFCLKQKNNNNNTDNIYITDYSIKR